MTAHPLGTEVLVTSPLRLLSETVHGALRARGLNVSILDWMPVTSRPDRGEVGIILADLDEPVVVLEVLEVVRRCPATWIISTTAPRSDAWLELLEAGVAEIVPGEAGIDEMVKLVVALPAAVQEHVDA